MSDGTYFHKLAEAWLKHDPLLPQSEGPVQDRMREWMENGGMPSYITRGTEVQLEMPLGRHTLVGTLDGIMPAGTGETFYSMQWKTCAGGSDLERKCDEVKFSYYEAAYEALMNHNGWPCAGTFLGVYKKLTKGELLVGANPFSTHILVREGAYVAQILRELERIADEMEAAALGHTLMDLPLLPTRRSCIMGFARCQYWGSCYEGVPLSDLRYEDSPDRYAPQEET